MRLLTLNIRHGGGSRRRAIAEFIETQAADVVVLTEYRANDSGRALREAMSESGLRFQATGSEAPRVNSVCIASRFPFARIDGAGEGDADAHRLLVARFEDWALAGVYFPQKEAKRRVFERIRGEVLPALGARGVILGDLNTGRPFEDEAGDTFHCSEAFDDLLASGLVDAWRRRNPLAKEFTWFSRANNGFRIDHALCTPAFDASVRAVQYLHEPRLNGVTDHSGLVVEVEG
jgi:exonuclease III